MELQHHHAFLVIKILFLSINLNNLYYNLFLSQIMLHVTLLLTNTLLFFKIQILIIWVATC